ncbi:MAG TPA: twin-arginine translocase subunit TatC [Thermoplasmata archaeon]|nr:twin-arginine translocase subunit TatC [Thermoplasmata archaeon]
MALGEGGLFASIMEHVDELRVRVIRSLAAFFLMLALVILFGYQTVVVAGFTFAYPWPDPMNNLTIHMFQRWRVDLLPADVKVLNIGVGDLLIAQMQIGVLLATALALPMMVYQVSRFISPALYRHEKDLARRIILPALVLFIAGMVFCYYLVLPYTFEFLFQYTGVMGVDKTVAVTEFVDFVVLFMLVFGFIFDIPVFMAGLTWAGVVRAETWKGGWRWALVGSVLVGAFITPDGSGVTQMIVAIPMILLYAAGYGVSRAIERGKQKNAQKAGQAA